MARKDISDFMAEIPDACKHPRQRLTRREFSNGSTHFVRQCENCWAQVGSFIKKEDAVKEILYLDDVPFFDFEKKEQIFEEEIKQRRIKAEELWAGIRAKYHKYLDTPEWREKSLLVRKRHPICQGCGMRRSTQAHHLTYDNCGDEFLWQLVAVCDDCHERAHPEKHHPES